MFYDLGVPPPSIETNEHGRAVVVKVGTGDTARRRRHEADILRRAQHPGVVQLVEVRDGDGQIELRLDHVPGPSLATHPPLGATRLASIGAAVAATLADLHEMGVVHGNLSADHILVTGDGRVVLCGFADGAPSRSPVGRTGGHHDEDGPDNPDEDATAGDGLPPRVDVIELGRLLRRLLDLSIEADVVPPRSIPGDRLGRVADSAADPHGPVSTAADLARRLSDLVGPEDRAPVESRPVASRRGRRQVLMGAGAVVGVAMAVAGATAGWRLVDRSGVVTDATPPVSAAPTSGSGSATGVQSTVPATSTAPSVVQDGELLLAAAPRCERIGSGQAADVDGDGCPENWSAVGGDLEVERRHYVLGGPDDLLTVGDWDCDGSATPALVEVSSGSVFLFDRWATEDAEVTVPAVGQVTAPTVIDVVASGGCDRLVVTSSSGDHQEFAVEEVDE